MAKVTNPSKETYKIENAICAKRKIGKIPPTHNIRFKRAKFGKKKKST